MANKSKQKIMQANSPRPDDFSKCSCMVMSVESIETKKLTAQIGSDSGLTFLYKMKDEDDIPQLFSVVKIWYTKGQKKADTILRHTIRKYELYKDDLTSDEPGEVEVIDD